MHEVLMDCAGRAERRRRFGGRGPFESGVDAPLCRRGPILSIARRLLPLTIHAAGPIPVNQDAIEARKLVPSLWTAVRMAGILF